VAFSPWHPTTVQIQGATSALISEVLGPLCEKYQATPRQIAIAWLLSRSPVMLPIPGTSNSEHLEEFLGGARIDLAAAEVDAITQLVPEG
jgi:pyridoxine 4-dehydrogenase